MDDLFNIDGVPQTKEKDLLASYEALSQAGARAIINETINNEIISRLVNTQSTWADVVVSILNLFELSLSGKQFFIAQVQVDRTVASTLKYSAYYGDLKYFLWGTCSIRDTSIQLALSAQTFEVKIATAIVRLFHHHASERFETNNDQFDEKYLIETNRPDFALNVFDNDCLNVISKLEGLHLEISDGKMLVGFVDQLNGERTKDMIRLFTSMGRHL